jgi:hypothetical protein
MWKKRNLYSLLTESKFSHYEEHPKEVITTYKRETSTFVFIGTLFTIGKIWNQPRYPLKDKWL